MIENRMLSRIFGRKMDELTGEWRQIRIEELNNLYFSLNIIRVLKSKRIRWERLVARIY
jgi:hypothetical protein